MRKLSRLALNGEEVRTGGRFASIDRRLFCQGPPMNRRAQPHTSRMRGLTSTASSLIDARATSGGERARRARAHTGLPTLEGLGRTLNGPAARAYESLSHTKDEARRGLRLQLQWVNGHLDISAVDRRREPPASEEAHSLSRSHTPCSSHGAPPRPTSLQQQETYTHGGYTAIHRHRQHRYTPGPYAPRQEIHRPSRCCCLSSMLQH